MEACNHRSDDGLSPPPSFSHSFHLFSSNSKNTPTLHPSSYQHAFLAFFFILSLLMNLLNHPFLSLSNIHKYSRCPPLPHQQTFTSLFQLFIHLFTFSHEAFQVVQLSPLTEVAFCIPSPAIKNWTMLCQRVASCPTLHVRHTQGRTHTHTSFFLDNIILPCCSLWFMRPS